jgi:hypothetical protein
MGKKELVWLVIGVVLFVLWLVIVAPHMSLPAALVEVS